MSLIKTCKSCINLGINNTMRTPLAYCKNTDFIVPHESDGIKITFWRIPESCPRDDVIKSKKIIPKKEWQFLKVSEITK